MYKEVAPTTLPHVEAGPAISPERQELLDLQATGEYVFHGGGQLVDELEPRQAHTGGDAKIPDGPPAVFASSEIEYAIFKALVNQTNFEGSLRSGTTEHAEGDTYRLSFSMCPNTHARFYDHLTGYVYVFKKEDFQKRSKGVVEYKSLSSVKPVKIIKVSRADFPHDIELIPDE